MRYPQLDGLRGLLLISMTISHTGWNLRPGLSSLLVMKNYSIADVASGFVFLSGLAIAISYGKKYLADADMSAARALRRRAWTIYRYHAVMVLIVTALAIWARASGKDIWIFNSYQQSEYLFGLLSLLTLAGGWCIDILPMYVVFVLITPAALAAMKRGQHVLVGAISVAVWAVGQSGIATIALDAVGDAAGLSEQGIVLGLYFNRLSWQLLYFAGLMAGMLYLQGKVSLKALAAPGWYNVFLLCVAFCLFCSALVISPFPIAAAEKPTLNALVALNCLALAFVVLWLLTAGTEAASARLRGFAIGFQRFVCWRPLVFLGQHSLQVFAFHIIMAYLLYTFVDVGDWNPWLSEAVVLLAVLLVYGAAWLHARVQAWRGEQRPGSRVAAE